MRFDIDDREKKRNELWRRDKTSIQIFRIQLAQAWRKFDLQTRGMGLYLLCMMAIMIMVIAIPHIIAYTTEELNKSKYRGALETSCMDKTFYAWNFKSCEDIGVRPEIEIEVTS